MRRNRGGWMQTMRWIGVLAGVMGSVLATNAAALTINVKTPDGQLITTGFRYTIEQDMTFDVVPGCTGISPPLPAGCPATTSPDTLSLSFHRSYMPVTVAGQCSARVLDTDPLPADCSPALDSSKRYFVSVLPLAVNGAGVYSTSGAPVRAGQTSVDITVDVLPLKTAQISILLFNDNNPINNIVDAPPAQERGLCGFEVHLYDAGGTYGASGGRIFADTFGNPLGTTYASNGDVVSMGDAILKTDVNGVLRIKNLAPAKYTIFALPPMKQPTESECQGVYGSGTGQIKWDPSSQWSQTSTIEGTWGIDAWVKSGEPPYFKEFGPPGHHVVMGFVQKFQDATALNGTSKVSGKVVNVHMSRPPSFAFFSGEVVDQCWIGLNEVAAGVGGGRGVYAGPCNPDGSFEITGLLPGRQYQLAMWDTPLDQVFALYNFVTPADGTAVALNDVPVFRWFGKWEGRVCHDQNEDGFCADTEPGIPGQAVNLRFRDGSIYQSSATDETGAYELTEIFPFFNWMVSEIDFTRYKATGATVVVDAGGEIPPDNGWTMPSRNKLTPQPQPDNGGAPYRTEPGLPVLLQGMQTFLGSTNLIDWGKKPYTGTENGGISGIVYYASTRAENDPRYTAGENNEPGIPGVTVRLYRADPTDRRKSAGPAVAEVTTDSWDASVPGACAGDNMLNNAALGPVVAADACFDGLRNYNQVRPAVFDGGFAFTMYEPNGIGTGGPVPLPPGNYIVEVVPPAGYEVQKEEDKNVDFGDDYFYDVVMQALPPECVGQRPYPVPAELTLFPGVFIPDAYRDNPPDNSGTYTNYTGRQRPLCNRLAVTLNAQHNPPANFFLFTKAPVAGHIVGMILDDLANEFSPYAPTFGEKYGPPFMPVSLRDQAGREFSRVYSDRFGTYNALVPSTFSYNIPIPSGVSPNMVQACLNSPYMPDPANPGQFKLDPFFNKSYSQFCYTFQYLPGKTTYLDTPVLPLAAFAGPQQFPLDCEAPTQTPAIASVNNTALNSGPYVNLANRQLTIRSMGQQDVLNPLYNQDNPAYLNPVTGRVEPRLVPRDYGFGSQHPLASVSLEVRNAAGDVSAVPLDVNSWTDGEIRATISPLNFAALALSANRGGTLLVTRRNAGNALQTTQRGVFVHAGGDVPVVVGPTRLHRTIQAAVDATADGGLITVEPGIYEESVILHKRLRVQGYGAGTTLINAIKQPTEKQQQWREKVCGLVTAAGGNAFLLPGQVPPAGPDPLQACITGDTADNAPLLFGVDEGAGFFVMVKDLLPVGTGDTAAARLAADTAALTRPLHIDGFTITGADQGGGVMANGYARRLQVSNNRITGNQGIEGGGIRIGHANLVEEFDANQLRYVASRNTSVDVFRNEVVQNGNTAGDLVGGGGGVSLFTGAHGYRVNSNFVCGNYSTGDGGGIAHIGQNANSSGRTPTIDRNAVLFNQSFNQGTNPNGGGLAITGLQTLVATNPVGLSTGTGSVLVNANTFQGNLAGAGDGGGISLNGVNGSDSTSANSSRIDIVNNVIDNNVAGVAGGGIALQDAINVRIINNTITRNDSVATGSRAFEANVTASTPQPGAGVAARTHSTALASIIGAVTVNGLPQQNFSNPLLRNSIVQNNRIFYWEINPGVDPTQCLLNTTAQNCYGLKPNFANNQAPVFSDTAVLGGNFKLTASYSMLTPSPLVPPGSPPGFLPPTLPTLEPQVLDPSATNTTSNPAFRCTYYNGGRDSVIQQTEVTALVTAAAFDEGGNFIDARFGPLTLLHPVAMPPLQAGAPYGDYRIPNGSPANNSGNGAGLSASLPELLSDRVGTARAANGNGWSRGAYEGVAGVNNCTP